MNLNLIGAGIVSGLAIRVLALIAATASTGSWWIALIAVGVLDWVEGAGRREVEQWKKTFHR